MERPAQLPKHLQLDLKKKTLSHLWKEAALSFPGKTAVSSSSDSLTFKELDDITTAAAQSLLSKGLDPNPKVAVFADRSFEMIIAMLAIWKAGGVYIPIDPLLQKQKISAFLDQTKPQLLLSGVSPIPSYLQDLVPSFSVKELGCAPLREGEVPADAFPNPKDAAYIVFTTDLAGAIKGIEINHMGAVNLVYWNRCRHHFNEDDTAALIARPCSDLSIGEVITTLLNGAHIKIAPHEAIKHPQNIIDWVQKEQITLMYLPVPHAEALLQSTWPIDTSLRLLFTGGSQLKKHPKQNLPFALINNYGPPENTIISTEYLVAADEESLVIPIGQPIANVKTYVLDERMQEVPHGSAGQLCLGGIALSPGYLNDAELNHKRFIVHTRLGKRPEKLFLTGDLVRKRNDGKLEYLGKMDQQQALGDRQIGISTVETILHSHPGVKQTVIKLFELESENILVAYWVQDEGAQVTQRELKRSLKKRLPSHLIPKKFIQLNQIPIGTDGKICTEQLPLPSPEETLADNEDLPQNPIEKQLHLLWQEGMDQNYIGVHKSLFDLRASSSYAKNLLSRINQHFGKNFTLLNLLQNDSIAKMAELIMTPSAKIRTDGWLSKPKESKIPPLFCVHGLEGDLFPYYLLSKSFRQDIPIYCLPAKGDDDSIEKMAEDYAHIIQEVYPEGAIHLLGFSLGSYVVFEMARHFQESQREAPFVGIIDTFAPHCLKKHPLLKRLQINTSKFLGLSPQEKRDFIIERWQQLEQKTSHLLKMKSEREADLIPPSLKLTYQKAMDSYFPKPSQLPLTIFVACDQQKGSDWILEDPSKGWKDFTNDLRIEKIQSSSKSLLEIPHIKLLADQLKKSLNDLSSHS